MEFFKVIEIQSTQANMQPQLLLQNIDQWCESIFPLTEETDQCMIGSNWGEFQLRRDCIKGGVRFSMLDCPNALAWTITTGYPPKENAVVIHLTINRIEKDSEFVEEIKSLLNEFEMGLKAFLR